MAANQTKRSSMPRERIVKTIWSYDRTRWVDIIQRGPLYTFRELPNTLDMRHGRLAGDYVSAEFAEANARSTVTWLADRQSGA
jgi:hypothetical protein